MYIYIYIYTQLYTYTYKDYGKRMEKHMFQILEMMEMPSSTWTSQAWGFRSTHLWTDVDFQGHPEPSRTAKQRRSGDNCSAMGLRQRGLGFQKMMMHWCTDDASIHWEYVGIWSSTITNTGWWLSPTPLKEYDIVSWDDYSIPKYMEKKCCTPPTTALMMHLDDALELDGNIHDGKLAKKTHSMAVSHC